MSQKNTKINSPMLLTAWLSLALALLKIVGFLISGSLIILNSALDSTSDFIVSLSNNFVFIKSRARRTFRNPYGYAYFEVLSSFAQGVVLLTIGIYIFMESIENIITRTSKDKLQGSSGLILSIAIMVFSAFAGLGFSLYLKSKNKKLLKKGHR